MLDMAPHLLHHGRRLQNFRAIRTVARAQAVQGGGSEETLVARPRYSFYPKSQPGKDRTAAHSRYSYYPKSQPGKKRYPKQKTTPKQKHRAGDSPPTWIGGPPECVSPAECDKDGVPFWYPEDADYRCERNSVGLCIVDPILCPSVTNNVQHEEIDRFYERKEKLGEGSFGVVYAARSRQSGEDVACKSVKKARLDGGSKVNQIRQEVQIMQLVAGHRNVVNIKGAYEDADYVHIVMDLCKGGHLLDYLLKNGPLDERTAARMTYQIAQMLVHVHDLNVMHRDVKPENFLLTESDIDLAELKATDFGLSKFCEPGESFDADLGGSPYYLAPEQIDGSYDCKADVWGLGVTLYECLAGHPPFLGIDLDDSEQVYESILTGHLDLHSGQWRYVSEGAKDMIMWLLHRDPRMRPTAADVLEHPWLRNERNRQCMEAANEELLQELDNFSKLDALKQLLLCVVGRCVPQREILGIERMFQAMDTNYDGIISVEELEAMAQRGHWALTPEEMHRSIMHAQASCPYGTLTFDDFVATTLNATHLTRDLLLTAAFRQLDRDHSGDISPQEMVSALRNMGMEFDGVEEMMYAANPAGGGHISHEKFVMLVRDTEQAAYSPPSRRAALM